MKLYWSKFLNIQSIELNDTLQEQFITSIKKLIVNWAWSPYGTEIREWLQCLSNKWVNVQTFYFGNK